jgi:hypothetical protein
MWVICFYWLINHGKRVTPVPPTMSIIISLYTPPVSFLDVPMLYAINVGPVASKLL